MSKENAAIPVRTRGPFQGAGVGGVDLKASPAGAESTDEVELAAQCKGYGVPVRFFPQRTEDKVAVSRNGSVTTFMFLGLENALLFSPERSEKAGDGNFHSTWISESNLSPGSRCRQNQTAPYRRTGGAAWHCAVVSIRKVQLVTNGPLNPTCHFFKNTVGMKESLI